MPLICCGLGDVLKNKKDKMKRSRNDDEVSAEDDIRKPLTAEEEEEARKYLEIARRAEQRALEKQAQRVTSTNGFGKDVSKSAASQSSKTDAKFLSKKEREELALKRLNAKRDGEESKKKEAEEAHNRFITGRAMEEKRRHERLKAEREELERERRQKEENKEAKELDGEIKAIRDHYLGATEKKRKIIKPSEKFAKIFQFDWEEDDDTSKNDLNPLYNNRQKIHALFGRGYIAGIDQREQRKESNFLVALSEKRVAEIKKSEEMNSELTEAERRERARKVDQAAEALRRHHAQGLASGGDKMGTHWSEKPLQSMTDRDWRIFREDFDIRIQGGRATLPLRYWKEANFPPAVLRAIEDMGYEKPSPIQRQAIPIGQSGRDIIGIAETGSGKTAAFVM